MKKMMFNDKYGLTQAVLDGRKTMTRRIVPQVVLDKVPEYQELYYAGALESISVEDAIYNMIQERMFGNIPRVGEIVAIAQSYETMANGGYLDRMLDGPLSMKKEYTGAGYKNKMFVKPELMPHAILMTSLRVEHLQDISDEDCLREGVRKWKDADPTLIKRYPQGGELYEIAYSWDGFKTPRDAFAALIDGVSKKGTWDSNPLVLAYELKLVK